MAFSHLDFVIDPRPMCDGRWGRRAPPWELGCEASLLSDGFHNPFRYPRDRFFKNDAIFFFRVEPVFCQVASRQSGDSVPFVHGDSSPGSPVRIEISKPMESNALIHHRASAMFSYRPTRRRQRSSSSQTHGYSKNRMPWASSLNRMVSRIFSRSSKARLR
jgi:hypothetical protein